MRVNRFILVLLTVCLVQNCPGQLLYPTQPQGTIEVNVVNGTPDGHTVIGDLVTVNLKLGQEIVKTLQGKVNAESKAVFNNVRRTTNLMAHVSCEHEGAPFYGQPVPFFPDFPDMPATITVFDVTTDKSSLSVQMHHITMTQVGDLLQVDEIMMISNSAMMAIKPEVSPVYNQPVVIEIFLPQGFQDFQAKEYFNPDQLVWTDEGFFDPVPIAPGEGRIEFSYALPLDAETADIAKKFSLPTGSCVIFVKAPNVEVTGLGPVSNMSMGGAPVSFYQLSGKQPGDVANIQLAGITKMANVPADKSSISVMMHHITISQTGALLQVDETMMFRNSAMMPYQPEMSATYNKPVSLEIFLPEGHQGFQSNNFKPEDLVWTKDGFFDTNPINPGEGEFRFTYFLDIDSEIINIAKKFSLPTNNGAVVVNVPNVEVSGLGAPMPNINQEGGTAAKVYPLSGIMSGDVANIQLSGFPQKEMDFTWIVLVVVFLVVLGVAIRRMKPKKN